MEGCSLKKGGWETGFWGSGGGGRGVGGRPLGGRRGEESGGTVEGSPGGSAVRSRDGASGGGRRVGAVTPAVGGQSPRPGRAPGPGHAPQRRPRAVTATAPARPGPGAAFREGEGAPCRGGAGRREPEDGDCRRRPRDARGGASPLGARPEAAGRDCERGAPGTPRNVC